MYNPEEECKAMIDTLKRMCKQRNITPHALAKEAGISTSTISYLMNGRTKPQVYTILLLCNVLGISISQLFEDKDTNRNVELSGIEMKHLTCEEEKILIAYHCLVLYSSSVYSPSPRTVCYTVWRYCGLVFLSYHSMVIERLQPQSLCIVVNQLDTA